jgi:hypothetical protein
MSTNAPHEPDIFHWLEMDWRFCAAMRAATECPPEGVFKDTTPLAPGTRFYPMTVTSPRSAMGSPGSLCADCASYTDL